jgi:predicted AlkP superfamily pyrophosphatase or phosphodiesterase
VQAIFGPSEYGKLGIVTPDKDPRMGDLVLSAKEGYTFSDKATGDVVIEEGPLKGSHGYLPNDPKLYATLVVWGAGIKPGVKLPVIDSVDVAPTIARVLGLKMENVDGKIREEILK